MPGETFFLFSNNNLYLKLLHISTTNISSVELLLRLFKNMYTLYRPQQTNRGALGPKSDALPIAPSGSESESISIFSVFILRWDFW